MADEIGEAGELTLEEAVGQLLVVGFEGEGPEPPAAIVEALGEGALGGVILFRRNVADEIEQLVELTTALHRAAGGAPAPPLVCVDQEGGRVVRVREPLTSIRPMRELGRRDQPRRVADVSEVVATELGAIGFNVNFAPVLDVDTNEENPVIGDRAFSDDPERVARLGGAWVVGHLTSGVIPCGKHYPGHGGTEEDSHRTLPTVEGDRAVLEAVELYPFRRAAEFSIPMLMTAHILVPELDERRPATLSSTIIEEILRGELGYQGVVITDDLEMEGVAAHYDIDELVELTLRAGVDLQLICHTESKWRRAREVLLELASEQEWARDRIYESAGRVLELKRVQLGSTPRPWTPPEGWREVLGCAEHREIVEKVGASGEVGEDPTDRSSV